MCRILQSYRSETSNAQPSKLPGADRVVSFLCQMHMIILSKLLVTSLYTSYPLAVLRSHPVYTASFSSLGLSDDQNELLEAKLNIHRDQSLSATSTSKRESMFKQNVTN